MRLTPEVDITQLSKPRGSDFFAGYTPLAELLTADDWEYFHTNLKEFFQNQDFSPLATAIWHASYVDASKIDYSYINKELKEYFLIKMHGTNTLLSERLWIANLLQTLFKVPTTQMDWLSMSPEDIYQQIAIAVNNNIDEGGYHLTSFRLAFPNFEIGEDFPLLKDKLINDISNHLNKSSVQGILARLYWLRMIWPGVFATLNLRSLGLTTAEELVDQINRTNQSKRFVHYFMATVVMSPRCELTEQGIVLSGHEQSPTIDDPADLPADLLIT